ncbi:hypothetical protein [Pseudorhodoplanes sp.]|uniref:hypothetical protein n=1 Tax=Pseudorhodoplanes sp. TaxID=1934341 RepID=UPI002C221462|nr:hypothetical protein [Pseudorhodoplanes sp.]HWV53010.1 hypothetical protein [Pseudorhodoplanes sp.]
MIAVLVVAGSQFAIHVSLESVARVATLESRLFQPELRPSGRFTSTAVAQASTGTIR